MKDAEDEVFDAIEKAQGWRKRQIAELDHENRMMRARNERLERELSEIKAENAELYGLLGMAHMNLKQHLEHGFNSMTAQSTLISVGRLYPKLKEKNAPADRNFCSRCGKRLGSNDWDVHTCTPPQGKPMTKDEALKLALEALEVIYDRAVFDYSLPADHFAAEGAQEAITAIKEALAQPEQEPVAWLQFKDNEPPVVAPRNLGTPVFLGIRGGLAHDAQNKE